MGEDNQSSSAGSGSSGYDDGVYEFELEMKETSTLYFVLFSILLTSVLILSKVLHHYRPLNKVLSEAALVLIISMTVGFFVDMFLNADVSGDDDSYQSEETSNVVKKLLSFSPNIFFMALLPPIIFNSGFQLRRELFYRHISPIALFAAVGTTLSAMVCAGILWGVQQIGWIGEFDPTMLELLAFGSLIAATDTVSVIAVLQTKRVDPHLFYVVFGESALNDAVALVLFNTFAHLLRDQLEFEFMSVVHFLVDFLRQAVGSPALGICFGAVAALAFKKLDFRKHEFRMLELSLYLICMYLPFILAELLHLSGIVSIFFAGISVRRYAEPNIASETSKAGESIFKVAAFLAETCIFIELGLSIFGFSGSFHWKFCLWALLACLLGRAAAIYPLTYVHNFSLREMPVDEQDTRENPLTHSEADSTTDASSVNSHSSTLIRRKKRWRRRTPVQRKDKKISVEMAHVLWFAGLRGAVAYACVREFPNVYGHDDEFIAATMFIILFTVIIMGGGTEYLLEYLGIEMGVDEEQYMFEWRKEHELKGTFHDLGKSRYGEGFSFTSEILIWYSCICVIARLQRKLICISTSPVLMRYRPCSRHSASPTMKTTTGWGRPAMVARLPDVSDKREFPLYQWKCERSIRWKKKRIHFPTSRLLAVENALCSLLCSICLLLLRNSLSQNL